MELKEVLEKKIKSYLALILRKEPKNFLSIDFGQVFVKILYFESAGKGFKLVNYDLKEISSAEKNRGKPIVGFITNFLKTNSISTTEVYLSISEPGSVIIRSLTLPAIPRQEVPKAVKWELKDEVPFNLEEALIDWQIAKEYTDAEGAKKNAIMVILAKAETIEKYLSYVNDCGLSPVGISSGPFNYSHVLRYSAKGAQIQALLDIGYKETTLCLYKDKRLAFLRKLTFSADRLTRSLTTTLVSDQGKLTLSYEEAESIKKSFGIPEDEASVLENNIQATQVISLMRPLLEELVRELKHSFDYFTASFREGVPAVLYLTGGGANLKNLAQYLHQELKINVVELAFPDCIDRNSLKKERLDKERNQLINAAGAILAGPGAINLVPQEVKTQKVELIERISLKVVTVAVGVVFLFSLFVTRLQIRDYQNRLKNAQVHLQTIGEIKGLKQKVDLREGLINKIQNQRVPVDGMLKTISALVPNNIVLSEMRLARDGDKLVLKGEISATEGITETALTKFMEDIEASSFFIEATLLSFRKIRAVQEFEIDCELAR